MPYLCGRVILQSGVAILLGSERDGLGPFWMENQDESLVIPMSGSADSLNLSVSAACFLYEAVKAEAGPVAIQVL